MRGQVCAVCNMSLLIKCLIVCTFSISFSSSIYLGEEEEKLLKELLGEFSIYPQHGRYDQFLRTSFLQARRIPKVFIWCPIRHNSLSITCPLHGCQLRIGQWTDVLHTSCPRNPRLVYDLNGNVLLVQTFYECDHSIPGHRMKGHKYLSACNDILNILPNGVRTTFPIILQQRSGFTLHLYDYVMTGIYQGQNFMELSDGIASMNFREFVRNNPQVTADHESSFQSNVFCFSPSNDKLMDLFLMNFDKKKQLYERNMERKTAKILTFDHTFKASKHIGITRDDGKFVSQFENVYLAVNENGEVIAWRFTKSTSSAEVIDLLEGLKNRLDQKNTTVEMIIVDDCCHTANLYQQTFPNVSLKLDLFHACSRIMHTITKNTDCSRKFGKEFPLIFRQNGDLDQDRTMYTPCAEDIEGNLERILFCWREQLGTETLHQIENLRKHIQKGCLSGIPPGCGTEHNERLHRHMNRTMLCGVSKIGPELAVAILACCLYAWNCKRKCKFHHNRSAPVPPIDLEGYITEGRENGNNPRHMKCSNPSGLPSVTNDLSDVPHSSTLIMENLKTETTFNFVIQRTLHLQEFVSTFRSRCQNRTVDIIKLLWSAESNSTVLIDEEDALNTLHMDLTSQHSEDLERNLSGLKLEIDTVEKDGNCFFTAVAKQLSRHLPTLQEEAKKHIFNIGLGNSVEEDAKRMRILFVEEMNKNTDFYKEWLRSDANIDLGNEIENFRSDAYFASDIGDICAKAISTVLRIPIILVTAFAGVPTIPFVPHNGFASTDPIYMAFNHSGPGHYDATKEISWSDQVSTAEVRCTCGKNNKDPQKMSCSTSRCACYISARSCSRNCRCSGCKNEHNSTAPAKKIHYETQLPVRGCSCGKPNTTKLSCKDSERKSKCPCVIRESGCTDICRCYNCGNVIQRGGIISKLNIASAKRNRETVSPYKRRKSEQFLKDEGADIKTGPWKELETLCLVVCKELLHANHIAANSVYLRSMYNFVVKCNELMNVCLPFSNEKSTAQVAAKILYLNR